MWLALVRGGDGFKHCLFLLQSPELPGIMEQPSDYTVPVRLLSTRVVLAGGLGILCPITPESTNHPWTADGLHGDSQKPRVNITVDKSVCLCSRPCALRGSQITLKRTFEGLVISLAPSD